MNAHETYEHFIHSEVSYRLREILNDEIDTSGLTKTDIKGIADRIVCMVDLIDYEKLDNTIRDFANKRIEEKKNIPSADKIEELANKIRDLLVRKKLWCDVRIYFNGKAYEAGSNGETRVIEKIDPHDYFKYAGDILSMSFEGPLYDEFNFSDDWKFEGMFTNLLKRYGYYYELGNAWNLTLYKN